MGSGPSAQTVSTNQAITQQQLNLAQQQQTQSATDTAQRTALEQPLINKETALAGGDRNAALAASMPVISQISAGYKGAKEQINSSLPPGPGRDAALAQLETQKATGIAGAEASAVQQAPEILANVGQGVGAFSLQELGASLSGFSGAGNTNAGTGSLQTQQSQAKWGPIVGLAQAAGSAAGSFKP